MSVGIAVLFFVLTPGILVSLPKGGSKRMVAAVHAVLFALVFHLLHTMVLKGMEGFFVSVNANTKPMGGTVSGWNKNVSQSANTKSTCENGKSRNASGMCE